MKPIVRVDLCAKLLALADGPYSKEQVKNVMYLIGEGASVNAKDEQGFTALHHAAGHGNHILTQLLLVNGADKSTKSISQEFTPEDIAEINGNEDVLKILRSEKSYLTKDKDNLTSVIYADMHFDNKTRG